jgi:predicted aconitase
MNLTAEETELLSGAAGPATRKAMEILVALGTIYNAERLIPVSSVQIAGVSYDNLGEAGLQFLTMMADGGGQARVLTTLNPAGMDVENWSALGISPEFARNQERVIAAFARMGVITTCTCTPYLIGSLPHLGEHIAWAESSAVCYANSVLGARTNREGGPSALAAALTGRTPEYGYHLKENRRPTLAFDVRTPVSGTHAFGALGRLIGKQLESSGRRPIPFIQGIPAASLEELKSFCASLATYGGVALFHMPGITPEAGDFPVPAEVIPLETSDLAAAFAALSDPGPELPDFISLGCPHLSIQEIAHLAALLEGKQVRREFWITTARPTKQIADQMGYTAVIQASGAKFAVDTCCVVAPVAGRFHTLVTDSAKAAYYASAKNGFHTLFRSFDEVVTEALK